MKRLLHIARREYLSYLRTPGFWLSLLLAPLVAGFAGLAPRAAEQSVPRPTLAVVDLGPTGAGPAVAAALGEGKPVARIVAPPPGVGEAATPAAAGRALRPYLTGEAGSGGVRLDAAAVLSGRPDAVSLDFWTRDINDPALESAVSGAVAAAMQQARLRAAGLDPGLIRALAAMRPQVRTFSPRVGAGGQVSLSDRLPAMLGLGLAFVLWTSVFTGAGLLLNSVIEEKSTRVLEVLLSSASVPEILGGKILGAAALSLTVIGGWAAIGVLALSQMAPGLAGAVGAALLAHGLIGWFALFYLGGYLMYAAMFAAIGAFCETVREAQTLLGPLMLVLTIPMVFLSLALEHPDAPLIGALSWIPPFTPFLMTARLAAEPPVWQIVADLALMGATTTTIVWLCARAFRAGALSSGKLDLKRLLSALVGG